MPVSSVVRTQCNLPPKFDLSSYSQRRAILEPSFLDHLNKKVVQSENATDLASRYLADFQTKFPE
jgi:hypothetical protein